MEKIPYTCELCGKNYITEECNECKQDLDNFEPYHNDMEDHYQENVVRPQNHLINK